MLSLLCGAQGLRRAVPVGGETEWEADRCNWVQYMETDLEPGSLGLAAHQREPHSSHCPGEMSGSLPSSSQLWALPLRFTPLYDGAGSTDPHDHLRTRSV